MDITGFPYIFAESCPFSGLIVNHYFVYSLRVRREKQTSTEDVNYCERPSNLPLSRICNG